MLSYENNIDNNDFVNEVDTSYSSIPESVSKKLFNSIVRIEFLNNIATGFFMKVKIKSIYLPCLLTNCHVIEPIHVINKQIITLFFGEKPREKKITIKLDKNERFIKVFNENIDATVIEILKSDDISEDKFLNYDLNYNSERGYKEYLNKEFCLAGYPKSKIAKKERNISSGKITQIVEDYKFLHLLDTKSGSSGSPICLLLRCIVSIT